MGVVVIELVGVDPIVMWALLPLVAFGSAFVPEVASFIAGQAAFTMMVLIIFNLIVPTGWSVGLIRVEDVIIGAMVGVVVSVLLWPRGAARRVSKVIDESFAVGAKFLPPPCCASPAVHPRRPPTGSSHSATMPWRLRARPTMVSASIFRRAVVQRMSGRRWCGGPTVQSGCAPPPN